MPWEDSDPSEAFTSQGAPGIARRPQKLGDRHGVDSFSEPSEGMGPADTWAPGPQTSGLQNCEGIYFWWFKLLSLQYFVITALGNSYGEAGDTNTVCFATRSPNFEATETFSLPLDAPTPAPTCFTVFPSESLPVGSSLP